MIEWERSRIISAWLNKDKSSTGHHIITLDKTIKHIDYDKIHPGGHSHWKIVLGHTALKIPIFRSLYSSWEQTHRFKPSFSSSLGPTSIFNAFSSPAIFAFQHYLIIIDIIVYTFMWIDIVWSPPPSPMYNTNK